MSVTSAFPTTLIKGYSTLVTTTTRNRLVRASSAFVLQRHLSTFSKRTSTTFDHSREIPRRRGNCSKMTTGTSTRLCATSTASSTQTSNTETNNAQAQLMQDMLRRVRANNFMPDEVRRTLIDVCIDGCKVGVVTTSTANMLCQIVLDNEEDGDTITNVFVMKQQEEGQQQSTRSSTNNILTLSDQIPVDCESRTKQIARVTQQLRERGIIQGWRDELLPISEGFNSSPLFLMERAAVEYIGGIEYGVHINGIVKAKQEAETDGNDNSIGDDNDNDSIRMWMARRSKTKSKYPGMLDHVVAGGVPYGINLFDNVIKECQEEAGIPEDIVRKGIKSAGAVSYMNYQPQKDTIQRSVLFCYELTLPPNYIPAPVDGEVEGFFTWSIPELLQSMSPDYPDPIKPNCYLVIIEYLMRNGYLSPDVPGYLDILRELRSGDCK